MIRGHSPAPRFSNTLAWKVALSSRGGVLADAAVTGRFSWNENSNRRVINETTLCLNRLVPLSRPAPALVLRTISRTIGSGGSKRFAKRVRRKQGDYPARHRLSP